MFLGEYRLSILFCLAVPKHSGAASSLTAPIKNYHKQ